MKAKKAISLFLALVMAMSCMSLSAFATGTWGGEGTEQSPYLIANAKQLAAMRDAINGENSADYANKYWKLTGNIDLTGETWEPIGIDYYKSGKYSNGYKTGKAFAGIFDGNNHKISNLNVSTDADPEDTANNGGWAAGLFGLIKGGTVQNLTIENATVSSATRFAGAVAGGVTGGTIQNCTVQGTVDISSRHFVGGIAGMSYGTITGCSVTATGTISANDTRELASEDDRDGDDVGGIVGYSTGTVTGNTVNATTGTLTVEGRRAVDAVVGAKYGTIESNTGSANVIYNIGSQRELEAFRKEVNAGRDFAGAIVNLDKDITLTGIWTPIGYSKRITAANNPTYTTLLNADPYFAGTFDGHNHTISGLSNYNGNDAYTPIAASIDSNAYVYGLFGVAGNGAVLKDVNFTNVAIDTTKTSGLSGDSVGTLVGYTFGNVTVDDVTVNGSIKGSEGVGAIVGRIYQGRFTEDQTVSLTNCSATATVSGDGTAKSKVSGLFGYIADHGKNQLYLTMTGNTFTGTESGGTFNSQIACLNTTLYNHAGYVTISGNKHGTLDTQSAIAQDGTDNIVVFEDVAATFIGKTDAEIASEIDEKDKVVVLDTTGNSNAETNTSYAAEKTTDANSNLVVTKYEVKVAEITNTANTTETVASVSSVKTADVIAKAKTSASNAISVGGTNTIELFVKADDTTTTTETVTYEVDPYAIVNSDTSNPVKLSNSDLNEGASFTFKVAAPAGATKVDVVHSWTEPIDGKTSETFKNQPVVNGQVEVTLTHFSSLSLTKSTEVVPTSTNTKVLGMNGWFADFFVLNIYVQTDVENPTFTLNREFESIGDFEQVTSRAAFCEANKAVFYVEKVSNKGANALGLNSTRTEECYMISVKFFTRYLDKAVTLTMTDGSETVYIQGYQYQNIGSNEIASSHAYSFIDYLNIMATYKTETGAADANAYANLYRGLQLAAQGAQGLPKS